MNIKDAKIEIEHTLRAYNRKDSGGRYLYPRIRQRPILLIGPPGIGKTAIVEQVAEECQVGLVSYTITHHTRQSAIGLPHIEKHFYKGQELTVTEYTMSEIIASVYACMERCGKEEGILFIDEINCVSETLAPTMLQFLQNKTFGSHRVPDGWLIVAAGNPPEYNKSVREFDIVTLDRVRKIELQENLDVWEEYAWEHQVHSAILSYLAVHRNNFYQVENTVDGKFFVTARGWEDLSEILKSYEELQIPVNWELVMEFLQKEEVARDFAAYYHLYQQYGKDYAVREILNGTLGEEDYTERISMMKKAGFDERITVTELLLHGLLSDFQKYADEDAFLTRMHVILKELKKVIGKSEDVQIAVSLFLSGQEEALDIKEKHELVSQKEAELEHSVLTELKEGLAALQSAYLHDAEAGFALIRERFLNLLEKRASQIDEIKRNLEHAFEFLEKSCGDGQELVLLVSALSRNETARLFLSIHECESYLKYSEKLLYREREKELQKACEEILAK